MTFLFAALAVAAFTTFVGLLGGLLSVTDWARGIARGDR